MATTTLADVLNKVQGLKKSGNQHKARCPAHDDKNPSLSITEKNGKVLLHCHAGCSQQAVMDALGIAGNKRPQPKARTKPPRGKPVKIYNYTNADGILVHQTLRYEPKAFSQCQPDPTKPGEYLPHLRGITPVLYRLQEVLQAVAAGSTILICEGEKDADTAVELGYVATTCAMGAKKWRPSYSQTLNGADVIILPHQDTAGKAHELQVVPALTRVGCTIRVVNLPAKDLTEWVEAGNTDLAPLLNVEPLADVDKKSAAKALAAQGYGSPDTTSTGTSFNTPRKPVAMEWQSAPDLLKETLDPIQWCVTGILPAGAALLAGRPKKGKSLLALNIAIAKATGSRAFGLYEVGKPGDVAYLCLEDGKRRMQKRIGAMLAEMDAPPARLDLAYQAPRVDSGLIDALDAWCTSKTAPALIIIDILAKVRAPRRGKSPDIYQDDYELIGAFMQLAEARNLTILVVTHTSKRESDDIFDTVMSSTGITGGTATNMVLTRKEEDGLDGVLTIVGKDVEDTEIGLTFRDGIWQAHGDATDIKQSEARNAVCEALYTATGKGITPKDIAIAIAKHGNATRRLLKKLKDDGYIKVEHGHYTLTTKGAEGVKHRRDVNDQVDLDSLSLYIPSNSGNGSNKSNTGNSGNTER